MSAEVVFQRAVDLIFALVVNPVFKSFAERYIELMPAERPRDEGDIACLRVKRKVLDVECTVSLYQSREQPQHRSVRAHNSVRHHVVVEFISSANTALSLR